MRKSKPKLVEPHPLVGSEVQTSSGRRYRVESVLAGAPRAPRVFMLKPVARTGVGPKLLLLPETALKVV